MGHMTLIGELEDTFGIDMDADDIIDLESFEKGKEILSVSPSPEAFSDKGVVSS